MRGTQASRCAADAMISPHLEGADKMLSCSKVLLVLLPALSPGVEECCRTAGAHSAAMTGCQVLHGTNCLQATGET